jgi:hypothetical protein
MAKVRVWRFSAFNVANGENEISDRYGTREAIAAAGGTPIEKSDIELDENELDESGMITIDSPPSS